MPNLTVNHDEYEQNGKKYSRYMISEEGKLPYLLILPEKINDGAEVIVESLNRENDRDGDIIGFDNRSLEGAMGTAHRIHMAITDAPIVIPIVPSIDGDGYYQELSRDCIEGKSRDGRIDTQYLECIESAKRKIEEVSETKVADKVFLNGYSASGVFAQRFALIHPEVVSKCCIGGAVGSIPIPEDRLPYPCGIKDFAELFGREFSMDDYKKIDFAYYVGEHEASKPGEFNRLGNEAVEKVIDENGNPQRFQDQTQPIMPMHDMSYHPRSMKPEIGRMQRQEYGETMNDRLENAIEYHKENGINFKAKIYKGVAHNDVRNKHVGIGRGTEKGDQLLYASIFSDRPRVIDEETGLRVVDVSRQLSKDISDFYHGDRCFEQDRTSVEKLDMHEQEKRDVEAIIYSAIQHGMTYRDVIEGTKSREGLEETDKRVAHLKDNERWE